MADEREATTPRVLKEVRGLTTTLGRAVLSTTHKVHRRIASGVLPPQLPAPPDDGAARHEEVDRYGFVLSLAEEQAAARARCEARAERQRAKWAAHPRGGPLPPEPRLKRLCRRGVPPELRRWVWSAASGGAARRAAAGPGYFARAAAAGKARSPLRHQIGLDVPRTFPNNAWAQSAEGQAAVRRVLLAFAAHAPGVGYCQGLNYVAALLLLAMEREEEDAFWVLASLVDDAPPPGGARAYWDDDEPAAEPAAEAALAQAPGAAPSGGDAQQQQQPAPPRGGGILYPEMYSRDLNGAHVEMRSLAELTARKLPRLGAHLSALGCDMSLLATDWFLCLFCTSVPAEAAARVWDSLLVEGPKVLFRVALALLRLAEPAALRADNAGEVLRAVRRAAAGAHDRDALMEAAFEGVGPLPMARLARYRAANQREVDSELAGRAARDNLRAAAEAGFVLSEADAELLRERSDDGGGSSSGAGTPKSARRGGGGWFARAAAAVDAASSSVKLRGHSRSKSSLI